MIALPNVLTRAQRRSKKSTIVDSANWHEFVDELSDREALELFYDWPTWARHNQTIPPGADWTIWMILAGRGWGKTRCGAEFVRYHAENGLAGRIALIAEDAGDARDVMVEGESGILAISHPKCKPTFVPSKRRLEWPNGAIATIYSDNDPETLRGPQHDLAWVDELAKFRNAEDMWSNLMFGLRLGQKPRVCITTTPKPIPIVRRLISEDRVIVTTGTTHENFNNLAPTFRDEIVSQYEGTRIGRQELYAEVIDPEDYGIVRREWFKLWDAKKALPEFMYVLQSYDCAYTEKTQNDPTACSVWGIFRPNEDSGLCPRSLTSTARSTATPAKRWTSCSSRTRRRALAFCRTSSVLVCRAALTTRAARTKYSVCIWWPTSSPTAACTCPNRLSIRASHATGRSHW